MAAAHEVATTGTRPIDRWFDSYSGDHRNPLNVRIHTIDGREFVRQLDYPKGDPRNPLTDKEVEEKFEALAEPMMSSAARRRAIDAIWNLERQANVTELMKLFRADR